MEGSPAPWAAEEDHWLDGWEVELELEMTVSPTSKLNTW